MSRSNKPILDCESFRVLAVLLIFQPQDTLKLLFFQVRVDLGVIVT